MASAYISPLAFDQSPNSVTAGEHADIVWSSNEHVSMDRFLTHLLAQKLKLQHRTACEFDALPKRIARAFARLSPCQQFLRRLL